MARQRFARERVRPGDREWPSVLGSEDLLDGVAGRVEVERVLVRTADRLRQRECAVEGIHECRIGADDGGSGCAKGRRGENIINPIAPTSASKSFCANAEPP